LATKLVGRFDHQRYKPYPGPFSLHLLFWKVLPSQMQTLSTKCFIVYREWAYTSPARVWIITLHGGTNALTGKAIILKNCRFIL